MANTSKQKLVQANVPVPCFNVLEKRAKRGGISVAATVRQILLREAGMDGLGGDPEAAAENVAYAAHGDVGAPNIVLNAPHAMRVESIVFDQPLAFTHVFIGVKIALYAQDTVSVRGAISPGDFPGNEVPVGRNCPGALAIVVAMAEPLKAKTVIRIVGKRYPDDVLPPVKVPPMSLGLVFRGEAVAKGKTTEAIIFSQETFHGELLVASETGWKIEAIEAARRKVHDSFVLQRRQDLDLPAVPFANEIRIVARNLGKKRPFEARLYGSTADSLK